MSEQHAEALRLARDTLAHEPECPTCAEYVNHSMHHLARTLLAAEQRMEELERQKNEALAYADKCVDETLAAEAREKALREALEEIETMAGAAGAGEMPAMPLAQIARTALAKLREEEKSDTKESR